MCILFIYTGSHDGDNDYSLILISNRDEFYDRPTQIMAPWSEDPDVIGGRDLEAKCNAGTWLALSPLRKKLGVLLNLPGVSKKTDRSRGQIVADFMKSDKPTKEYVEDIKSYVKECNDFVFVTVEFGNATPSVHAYNNATDQLTNFSENFLGLSNSLPETPLKKAEAGKQTMKEICSRFNKVNMKQELIEELIRLLKSDERHLPDQQLEMRRPKLYKELSSIFVCVPEVRYGTRTHSMVLITKSGHVDMIEMTMVMPIDPLNPKWEKTEFQFDI